MADILCPNCGKYNPENQETCQFCYTKLRATGELPPISGDDLLNLLSGDTDSEDNVPDWLQDLRPDETGILPNISEGDSLDWLSEEHEPVSPFEDLQDETLDSGDEDLLDRISAAGAPIGSPGVEDTFTADEPVVDPDAFLEDLPDFGTVIEPSDDPGGSPFQLDEPISESGEESAQPFEEAVDILSSLEAEKPASETSHPDLFTPSMDEPQPGINEPEAGQTAFDEDWLNGLGDTEFSTEMPNPSPEEMEDDAEDLVADDSQPDWLSRLGTGDLGSSEPGAGVQDLDSEEFDFSSEDEMVEWLSGLDAQDEAEPDSEIPSAEAGFLSEQPDWLSHQGEDSPEEGEDELADLPGGLFAGEPVDSSTLLEDLESPASPFFEDSSDLEAEDVPDWLRQASEEIGLPLEGSPVDSTSPFEAGSVESSDWFESEPQPESPFVEADDDTPDWLQQVGQGASPFTAFSEDESETTAAFDSIDDSGADLPAEEAEYAAGDTPDWLIDVGEPLDEDELVPEFDSSEAEHSFATMDFEQEEVPDWLSKIEVDNPPPSDTPAAPAFVLEDDLAPFGEDDLEPEPVLETLDETPSWLDQISEGQAMSAVESTSISEPEQDEAESLAPAELPGWLEAMRPSEGASIPFQDSSDDRVEDSGLLAGVPGILPAEYDTQQLLKPPTYAVKLQVSEEHQSRVDLLNAMLAEEEQPVKTPSAAAIPTVYILRLIILGVFLLGAVFALWAGNQQTPLPQTDQFPQPIMDFHGILDTLPDGAPVLLAFDYEPGSIPEMETAAQGVIDRLILKGSVIRTVSTNMSGPALASHLLTRVLSQPDRLQYAQLDLAHLGYIPGGPSGLRAFSQDPAGLMRYDLGGTESGSLDAWSAPNFDPDAGLANFKLVLLITDSADAARSWVEQVGPQLINEKIPLLMVVSAQAEPMVRPFYDTSPRQVFGMVTGVMGGAFMEKLNGRPGLARIYLDAYSVTVSVAVVLLVIGSLVNLVSGRLSTGRSLKDEGDA